jgi:hypothetical protein
MYMTITVTPEFLTSISSVSMIKDHKKNGTVHKYCPFCNRQVIYGSGQESKNPIQHKENCSWVLTHSIIRDKSIALS